MTNPHTSLRQPPVGALREVLQGIHDFLDLPFVADWDEEPQRDAEMQDRIGQLLGDLELALADGTVGGLLEALRARQAEPLPFTPETPAQTEERHARLAAHLADRRADEG